ncbi:response regulator transcription factor [Clostridiaceae bacterium 35-E11]
MDKIMVVDDEKDIIYMIRDFMKIHQIEVVEAFSGQEAIEKLDDAIKLLVLDINMEDMSGIELCKEIRKESNLPILFLTARSSQADKILGLGMGGDDYITKPFDPIELVARVQANLRRYDIYNHTNEVQGRRAITFDNIVVYPQHYRVLKNDRDIQLSMKEFELLLYFIKNAFLVLSREQILDNVWSHQVYDYNVVNTNIKRLRKKLEDDPKNPKYIKTIWGIGYTFEEKCKEMLCEDLSQ